jgi:hypothetical protein
MRKVEKVHGWVVYQMPVHGKAELMNAVCEQKEWEAMELAQPGHFTLIQANIGSEAEAEKLARGTSGDTYKSFSRGGVKSRGS